MPRADQVGERLLVVQGGGRYPVFFVSDPLPSEDTDRGVRSTVVPVRRLLYPRPTPTPVTGELITRQSSVLRLGDYRLEIAGNQVTEAELSHTSARIEINNEALRIVNYELKYVGGEIAYYVVFVRGVG